MCDKVKLPSTTPLRWSIDDTRFLPPSMTGIKPSVLEHFLEQLMDWRCPHRLKTGSSLSFPMGWNPFVYMDFWHQQVLLERWLIQWDPSLLSVAWPCLPEKMPCFPVLPEGTRVLVSRQDEESKGFERGVHLTKTKVFQTRAIQVAVIVPERSTNMNMNMNTNMDVDIHTETNLMSELEKQRSVTPLSYPSAPKSVSPFPSPSLHRRAMTVSSLKLKSSQTENVAFKPTPLSTRRASASSPLSPPLFGTLVGSYKESILSGRMSTLPSQPTAFQCRIGVTAAAGHSPHCPKQMTLSFSASFYAQENALPSPYVAHIPLEGTPFRLPRKGQLQCLVLSNVQLVHVFLVPFDLTEMPPGTKTLLRQKKIDAQQRLRHAIQIHFMCDAKGRIGLYRGLRLVFAAVSMKEEPVRIEVERPEPLYVSM